MYNTVPSSVRVCKNTDYVANAKVAGHGELLRRIVVASHKFRLFLSQVLPARLNRSLDEKGGLLLARHVNRLQQGSMILVS